MRAHALFVSLLFVVAEIPLPAQVGYPGQYPPGQYPPGGYPPGGYPPGQYPGGVGLPIPRRGKKSKTTKDTQNPQNLTDVSGILRKIDDKLVVVEAEDSRIISVKRGEKTRFLKNDKDMKPEDLKPGDHLRIECTKDDEGFFYAVNVNFEKKGTAEERAKAAEPVEVIMPASKDDDDRPVLRRNDGSSASSASSDDPDRPVLRRKDEPAPAAEAKAPPAPAPAPQPKPPATQSAQAQSDEPPPVSQVINQPAPPPAPPDPEDPGRPRLRRGGPARSREAAEETETPPAKQPVQTAAARMPAPPSRAETAAATPAAARMPENPTNDPVIDKAREKAGGFAESLPNYVCQEFMARFYNVSHVVNWQPQDVVSTEVVYENGKERYRNLAINGKKVNKGMEQLSGAWSTGEFGTILVDLFSPSTAADFRYRRAASTSGQEALVYDFSVERDHSHWHVQAASQGVNPAYRGTVWIDKRTYRVLRIEMQAAQIPEEFPLDKVETAVDYDYVRFGGVAQYLMPVHAETLSCQRGTNQCALNKIDFRNYHKYEGESSITYEK